MGRMMKDSVIMLGKGLNNMYTTFTFFRLVGVERLAFQQSSTYFT